MNEDIFDELFDSDGLDLKAQGFRVVLRSEAMNIEDKHRLLQQHLQDNFEIRLHVNCLEDLGLTYEQLLELARGEPVSVALGDVEAFD